MTEPSRYEQGLKIRRAVLGADYVDAALGSADEFMMAGQQMTTEYCWGYAWARQGLDRKTRSMINLGMLTALGQSHELSTHVRGALHNGVTPDEIKEILIQATVYCGMPAGLSAFRAAHKVLIDEGAL